MRLEGSTYLPVRHLGPSLDLSPVRETTPQRENRERQISVPRRSGTTADGFADALMNVSVQTPPVNQVAMLYEVQRLAQSAPAPAAEFRSTDAVIAYRDSLSRSHSDRRTAALPSLRA